MTKTQQPDHFGSKLLKQDNSLYSERYQEHRMLLENKLRLAERREKRTFAIVATSLIVAVVTFPLCAEQVFGSIDYTDPSSTWLSVSVGILYIASISTFLVGLASYYSRFRPATRRIADHLRDVTIQELRDEIRELRRQLKTPDQGSEI